MSPTNSSAKTANKVDVSKHVVRVKFRLKVGAQFEDTAITLLPLTKRASLPAGIRVKDERQHVAIDDIPYCRSAFGHRHEG
ncbi:hypothetical protein VCV18_000779 [Metarhizium anisopliae]